MLAKKSIDDIIAPIGGVVEKLRNRASANDEQMSANVSKINELTIQNGKLDSESERARRIADKFADLIA